MPKYSDLLSVPCPNHPSYLQIFLKHEFDFFSFFTLFSHVTENDLISHNLVHNDSTEFADNFVLCSDLMSPESIKTPCK